MAASFFFSFLQFLTRLVRSGYLASSNIGAPHHQFLLHHQRPGGHCWVSQQSNITHVDGCGNQLLETQSSRSINPARDNRKIILFWQTWIYFGGAWYTPRQHTQRHHIDRIQPQLEEARSAVSCTEQYHALPVSHPIHGACSLFIFSKARRFILKCFCLFLVKWSGKQPHTLPSSVLHFVPDTPYPFKSWVWPDSDSS